MEKTEASSLEVLKADHAHFGESLIKNEEVGERRFGFFLSLVTAVIAGLVALYTTEKVDVKPDVVARAALGGLLVFGLMTFLRMLHRNRVSDQYKQTLTHIRESMQQFGVALDEYRVPTPINAGFWKWFRGGLAESVGAINSVLLAVLLVLNGLGTPKAITIAAVLLAVSWALAAPRKGNP